MSRGPRSRDEEAATRRYAESSASCLRSSTRRASRSPATCSSDRRQAASCDENEWTNASALARRAASTARSAAVFAADVAAALRLTVSADERMSKVLLNSCSSREAPSAVAVDAIGQPTGGDRSIQWEHRCSGQSTRFGAPDWSGSRGRPVQRLVARPAGPLCFRARFILGSATASALRFIGVSRLTVVPFVGIRRATRPRHGERAATGGSSEDPDPRHATPTQHPQRLSRQPRTPQTPNPQPFLTPATSAPITRD